MAGLIVLLAIFVFVGSLIAAGGTFLYGRFLERSLESKKQSLETARGAYDPGVIEDLIRLDTRIIEARVLLTKHVAPSAIFAFLSEQTLTDVQFSSFDYVLKEDGSASVQLKGHAGDFPTVALQSDQFGASRMLKDVVFSDIAIQELGVSFSVSATIEPANLLYSKYLGVAVTLPPPDQPEPLLGTTTPTI